MTDFEHFTTFAPSPYHAQPATVMLDQLLSWSTALATNRS